jgi:RNA polymerase primary sigma factor
MSKFFVNYGSDGTINKYFKDVKKTDLLSVEKEIELAIKIQNGDKRAVDLLVESNLKFVVSIAKEYQNQGLPLSDLISEGNYGLVKAAHKFDHTKGFRFISYAVWWVKQSIIQSLNDNSRVIRLPTNVINKIYQLKQHIEKFEFENEREPFYGEVLNDDTDSIFFKIPANCSSLNDKINEDGDELHEIVEDLSSKSEDNFYDINSDIKKELDDTLKVLDDREREIIECYFAINKEIEPMTLDAIGEKLSLSKERVRQIKNKAIQKLRNNSYNLYVSLNK